MAGYVRRSWPDILVVLRFAAIVPIASLIVAACVADQPKFSPKPAAELAKAGRASKDVLFWSQDQRDQNFRRMEKLFAAKRIKPSRKPRIIPKGSSILSGLGGEVEVNRLMSSFNIAGLLVLQDGRIRLERYSRGFGPTGRWASFSIAKSITSTLLGAALKDGHVQSLDAQVVSYVPELTGSNYDGVTIRQILTMTSGVRWNENYTDPKSDIALMFDHVPPPGYDMTVSYLRTLPRESPPGTKWVYNTGETNLVGLLVQRATRKSLASYLAEKIWEPFGMESEAYWQLDEGGREIGGCCLIATLKDYGRLGLFMLEDGKIGNEEMLPRDWIAEATRSHADIGSPQFGYGYQWWTGPRQTYSALGIFGQMVYIDPVRRMVVVTLSAAPQAAGRELAASRTELVRRITEAIDQPSLANNMP